MMNFTENLAWALDASLEVVFKNIILFFPNILLGFLVLALGVWIAAIVSKIIGDLLRLARIDFLLSKIGVTQLFHDIGFRVSIAYSVQVALKWLLIIITFLSVANILGLYAVVDFIDLTLFGLLPGLATFAITLFVTFVVANKLKDLVLHSTFVARHHTPVIATLVWFMVVALGVLTAFDQLQIARFLTEILSGFAQALGLGVALALGLAFGLGCKEEARCLIRKWMGKDCYDLDCGCGAYDLAHDHDEDCECKTCGIDK